MEGIERIKRHILADADAASEKILWEAEAFARQTLDDSEKESRKILLDAEESASRDAAMLVRRGESLADSEKRKHRLAGKQTVVNAVIGDALEVLRNEPVSRRVDRYASWVRSLGVQEGVITLSEGEIDLKVPLLEALGHSGFTVAERGGSFSGGILVQHGRVSDNLTYDLAVRDNRPELARLIFAHLDDVFGVTEHA